MNIRGLSLALAVASLALLQAFTPWVCARAQTAQPTKSFGVYKGNGCSGTAAVPSFTAWDGHPVNRALDFIAFDSWASFQSDSTWTIGCWSRAGFTNLTLSVPMLVADGRATLAQGAAGAYTSYYLALASQLVKAGYADAVIRLGWEFNGGWYPWSAAKDPTSFIKEWRMIATAMRAVPGAAFKFDWCSSQGMNAIRQEQAYPGDDVVDIVSMDVYNAWWSVATQTPQARWTSLLTGSYGLNWLQTYAALHSKPMSIPEWGTGNRPDGHGGGDDPLFVSNMAAWISNNKVLYSDYWDYNAADYQSQVSNGAFPQSGAALKASYLKLVSNGS